MLLVCDSGSTKADWLLYDGSEIKGPYHTMGFNPFFHSSELVFETLTQNSDMADFAANVKEVKFFGAGCSSAAKKEQIAVGLRKFFSNADVLVDHDLLACAFATCGSEPGISCITGTGSNSCWFDGVKVHERNYGMGYILGDEGSGAHLGKKLLTHFLYNLLPADVHADFENTYHLTRDSINDFVYKKPNPNVWLASFSTFYTKHRDNNYIHELIMNNFRDFMTLYVCNYPDYQKVKVHFVGSIAFYFETELRAVAKELNVTIGQIVKQPVDGLLNYYINKK